MSTEYKKASNLVFPREEIIEWNVRYFGEEYKEYITRRINDINLVLVSENLFSFDIANGFKIESDKYGYPEDEWMSDAKLFSDYAAAIPYSIKREIDENGNIHYKSQGPGGALLMLETILSKYPATMSAMIENLNDLEKIKVETESHGVLEVPNLDTPEMKKFFEYAKYKGTRFTEFDPEVKIFESNGFLEAYERARTENKMIDCYPPQTGNGRATFYLTDEVANEEAYPINMDLFTINEEELKQEAIRILGEFETSDDKNFFVKLKNALKQPKMKKEYQAKLQEIYNKLKDERSEEVNKNIETLRTLFRIKYSVAELEGKPAEIYVEKINLLFSTNYTTVQEIAEDKKMSMFFAAVENFNFWKEMHLDNWKKLSFADETVNSKSIKKAINEFNMPGTLAYSILINNELAIPLKAGVSLLDILHETNHLLSGDETNVGVMGFLDFRTQVGRPFNEVVNQFISLKVLNQITDREAKEYLLTKYTGNSNYDSGIAFMQDFLNSFEDKLMECQMGKTKEQAKLELEGGLEVTPRQTSIDILKEYIGENNYNNLIALSEDLSRYNYAKDRSAEENRFVLFDEIMQVHNDRFKQDSEYRIVSNKNAHIYKWMYTFKDYLNKLTAMNEAVKRGEIEHFEDIEVVWDHEIIYDPVHAEMSA